MKKSTAKTVAAVRRSNGVKDFFSSIWRNKMSRVGLFILIFFLAMAVLGPIFLKNPSADYLNRLKGPSAEHWLGTDY